MRATHVRLGDFNYGDYDDDGNAVDASISEITVHPNYTDGSFYHNIAIIRLTEAVRFTSYIRPACLSQQLDTSVDSAVWSGWPMKIFTFPRTLHDSETMDLRKYVMKLISTEACNEMFASQNHSFVMPMGVSPQQLCAELKYKARSTLELRPLEVSFNWLARLFCSLRLLFVVHCRNWTGHHCKFITIATDACISCWDCRIRNQLLD